MPQYNSTDKRTQTIGILGYTDTLPVLEVIGNTTFAGDVSLGDSNVLNFGDGDDLRIFHSGTDGVITNTTGDLIITNSEDTKDVIIRTDNGSGGIVAYIRADGSTGEVQLSHYNAQKLATSSTGVTVTGTLLADSLSTGAAGTGINISTNTITGPSTLTIDPAAIGDNTGTVVIAGDLQIDGTTTTVNSTTMTVDDKNLELGTGAANDAAADGGGITVVSGDGNKTFQFEATGDNLGSSENLNLANTKEYKINNTSVLSATTLGTAVVNSSLTSVGTIGTGTWQGTAINDDYIGTIDNANKVALTALDIDGGTAATALTADDLFIIDDGAAGANLKITAALAKDYFASDVTSINLANEATDTETFLTFALAATGEQTLKTNANLTFNSSTGALSASTYIGNLTNALTLGVAGNGLTGSATYNNSAATTFTVTSNATSANTASTIVFRDASGNFTAGTITGSVLVSNVATGTAPLTVTSTTLVTNLNADLLDGQEGSFYRNASNINAGTLAIAYGGTNGSAIPTLGGAAYGTGTAYAFTAVGTSGQVLTSNGAAAPTWQDVAVAATDESTDTTCFPLFATDATGAVTLKTDASGLTYDSANERLQATDVTVKGAVRVENSGSTERFEILYNETTDSLDFTYSAS